MYTCLCCTYSNAFVVMWVHLNTHFGLTFRLNRICSTCSTCRTLFKRFSHETEATMACRVSFRPLKIRLFRNDGYTTSHRLILNAQRAHLEWTPPDPGRCIGMFIPVSRAHPANAFLDGHDVLRAFEKKTKIVCLPYARRGPARSVIT